MDDCGESRRVLRGRRDRAGDCGLTGRSWVVGLGFQLLFAGTGELIMSGDDHKDWIASVDFHPRCVRCCALRTARPASGRGWPVRVGQASALVDKWAIVGWFGWQTSSKAPEGKVARLWKNGKFVPNCLIFL